MPLNSFNKASKNKDQCRKSWYDPNKFITAGSWKITAISLAILIGLFLIVFLFVL